ncbi:tetratricopeptide repeat protein [Dyadobacter sp. CY323]|uniref:tetratricopeptide repeat protein n=1 Tax=Dyadobacter sp. CY323 TaxID=2907302 RepID=UPI001F33F34B|nr:tetratricopeptide repeat protein [Dyadobacter sp. CY323]MCE6990723.1 tetratricopeptide repeat protein [Dyadobacter sp. CY323]
MENFLHRCFFLSITYICCSLIRDCPEKINLLPMYGNAKKCPEQIEADRRFLQETDGLFQGDRKRAAEDRVARAWEYFDANVQDTAMMRFNQAWLLDSSNAEVYWGFGNLLGGQERFRESIPFFKKSLRLNPENPIVWEAAAQSYGNIYADTRSQKDLDSSIYYLRHSFRLDPKNSGTISKLTMAYLYAMKKDSATKYLKLAEQIDPGSVPDEIRRMIQSIK